MFCKKKAPPIVAQSAARAEYLAAKRRRSLAVAIFRWALLAAAVAGWEILARIGVIDSFVMSQPSRILRTLFKLGGDGLLRHVAVTCLETLAGFFCGVALGNLFAFALWWSGFLARVADPFLVVMGALPKIALGPVIIIWVGAGTQAIIVMALAISLIVTVLEMLGGFQSTDSELVKLAATFGASRWQSFTKIIFPYNLGVLFGSLKVNIGLTLVGVIAGEFLVSKAGLGYLIVYGGQVFQMDLVMASVLILAGVAAIFYQAISLIERLVRRKA